MNMQAERAKNFLSLDLCRTSENALLESRTSTVLIIDL